jgi:hypothetical protein
MDTNGDGDTFDLIDGVAPDAADTDWADDDEDENADGYINDPWEDVTFTLSGTDLIRTDYLDSDYCPNTQANCSECPNADPASKSEILATDIESLTFEYFSETDTAIAAPVTGDRRFDIKLVRVTINAKTRTADRLTKRPHTLQLRSDIFVRN